MAGALREGNTGGGVEHSGDILINLDELVSLDGDPYISSVDLGHHPLFEVAPGESADEVNDPLLWESGSFLEVIWDVSLEIIVPVDMAVDLLEAEALVLRHVDVADLGLQEILLLAGDDVPEEVY